MHVLITKKASSSNGSHDQCIFVCAITHTCSTEIHRGGDTGRGSRKACQGQPNRVEMSHAQGS
eukprot:6490506-Amphidinium_carterae.4